MTYNVFSGTLNPTHFTSHGLWMQAYKAVIVPEEMKEETKAAMMSPVTCHVYSVQNCRLKASETNQCQTVCELYFC